MHPALAILQICVGVNKINTFVVLLFYFYPGKVILPDFVKTVKKFQNKMLHVLLLFEREKKNNPASRIHDALASYCLGNMTFKQ